MEDSIILCANHHKINGNGSLNIKIKNICIGKYKLVEIKLHLHRETHILI